MSKLADDNFVGKVIGHWTVVEPGENPHTLVCKCCCGNKRVYSSLGVSKFNRGSSCGCKSRHPHPKTGDMYPTNNGDVVIIKRHNCNKIDIRFLHGGYECTTASKELRTGNVANPWWPTVYGNGYIGVGIYKGSYTGIHGQAYRAWTGILQRCYSREGNFLLENPTYADASVDTSWHNYQEFAEWYYKQLGSNYKTHVDKDLLLKGNKHYGPDTVVLVPISINSFLVGNDASRGALPKGVVAHSTGYRAQCQQGKGGKFLGRVVKTVGEAFSQYKAAKESYAKEIAAKWQSQIDPRAYNALMNYTVEITD